MHAKAPGDRGAGTLSTSVHRRIGHTRIIRVHPF
jgi:hypothetical protein